MLHLFLTCLVLVLCIGHLYLLSSDAFKQQVISSFAHIDIKQTNDKMVQLFYYETRGKCIRKIFTHEGSPTKIVLYPYEGWAQSALTSHWLLKTYWWSRSRVKITEVVGSQKIELKGKIKDCGHGNIVITGKYKERPHKDFRLCLTSNISNTDFDLGYCVTGTVERGDKDRERYNEKGGMDLTHFAMIKRKGY